MKHILVIDDEEAVRKSFVLALEDTGYQIHTADSGDNGIKKIEKIKYDLIFLDLKMPGKDGTETLQEIRKLSKNVPVYIVTAYHKEFFDKLKVLRDKGFTFELLEKPIGVDEINLITKAAFEGPILY